MGNLRIAHWSDPHGSFEKLRGRHDLAVLSGDFAPNFETWERADYAGEAANQLQWLQENVKSLRDQLRGSPLVFILGNHDWFDPNEMEKILNEAGIEAYSTHNKVVEVNGCKFYGFPYVPTINGRYNFERDNESMKKEAAKMAIALNNDQVEVLITHAPLHGKLDLWEGKHYGSTVLSNTLSYKIQTECRPNIIMHGHIHSSHSITREGDMLISNAATTQHIIEM